MKYSQIFALVYPPPGIWMLQHRFSAVLSQAMDLTDPQLLGHLLPLAEGHKGSVQGEISPESERGSQLPQAVTQEVFAAPLWCPLPSQL